jgi:hypothetical protein
MARVPDGMLDGQRLHAGDNRIGGRWCHGSEAIDPHSGDLGKSALASLLTTRGDGCIANRHKHLDDRPGPSGERS